MKEYKLLINGELVNGAAIMDVINPATGAAFAESPRVDETQLNQAVAAARAAFPAWAATPVEARRELLLSLASGIEARFAEFAETLTREQGKPLVQAQGEMFYCVHTLRQFASMDLSPKVLRENEQSKVIEYRKPLGVVATITPWNFPVLMVANKIGPALLAGNTLVIKPAPTTPLTTLLIGEVCAEIFPRGVVNVIVDNNDLGGMLSAHPDVAKVSFTGSTATGKKVLASATPTLKRVTLELGGNDAALVLDDVDVKQVAAQVYNAATYNAGQVCVAIKRLYVPDAMYEDFCTELVALAEAAVIGDGMLEATQVGPIQNKAQYEKVKNILADVQRSGKLIAGGEVLGGAGYFISPAIVRDVSDQAQIVAEEQFSPILPVLRYSDLDDAILRINSTPYGLAGSVWSSDLARAEAVAQQIDSGTIWVNSHMALDPSIPFRGAKQSGMGVELGEEGLHEYTQARVVSITKAKA